MKFYLVIFFAMMLNTFAFGADSSSGCGLGWNIAKDNSLLSSSTRSTTHAYLPNTFSMTSGTSGCAKHSIVMNEKRAIHFAESNYAQLMLDMAKGSGEYLNGFAEVVNYQGDREVFGKMIQQNYGKLYPSITTDADTMYQNFKSIVNEYAIL